MENLKEELFITEVCGEEEFWLSVQFLLKFFFFS